MMVAVILEHANNGVAYIPEVYADYDKAKARVKELVDEAQSKHGVCMSNYLVAYREVIE